MPWKRKTKHSACADFHMLVTLGNPKWQLHTCQCDVVVSILDGWAHPLSPPRQRPSYCARRHSNKHRQLSLSPPTAAKHNRILQYRTHPRGTATEGPFSQRHSLVQSAGLSEHNLHPSLQACLEGPSKDKTALGITTLDLVEHPISIRYQVPKLAMSTEFSEILDV